MFLFLVIAFLFLVITFLFLVIMFPINMFGVDFGVWPGAFPSPPVFVLGCWVLWPGIVVFLMIISLWKTCMCKHKHLDPGYNPSDSQLLNANRLHVWMQSFCSWLPSSGRVCSFVAWKLSNLNTKCRKRGVMFTPWQHGTSSNRWDEDCSHLHQPVAPPPPRSSMTG